MTIHLSGMVEDLIHRTPQRQTPRTHYLQDTILDILPLYSFRSRNTRSNLDTMLDTVEVAPSGMESDKAFDLDLCLAWELAPLFEGVWHRAYSQIHGTQRRTLENPIHIPADTHYNHSAFSPQNTLTLLRSLLYNNSLRQDRIGYRRSNFLAEHFYSL
jgi:hypothetical protein